MAARGVKNKIAFNVAILLLISAVLTDILVVIVMQSAMLRNEVDNHLKSLEIAGQMISKGSNDSKSASNDYASHLQCLLPANDFSQILIVNDKSAIIYQHKSDQLPKAPLTGVIEKVLHDKIPAIKEHGLTWTVYWWLPKYVSIAVPIINEKKIKGVVGGVITLEKSYLRIKQYHNPIYLYLIINTTILTFIGLYRIFRIYLKPIDRIVQQADDFRENVDMFFAFRQEDNELNRLSSALNRMLQRIAEDKNKLEETVMFLEHANEDLKNAQKKIIRAEKLASVGRLAAGVAHEIGNPIGIVLGYLEMLKQNDVEESDRIDFLKRSENEIQRINVIIRQLLDLARPKESQSGIFSLHECLHDIGDVMRVQPMMKQIDIVLKLNADQDRVWGNGEQMRQVFLNLILNAADAIKANGKEQGGRITIQSEVSVPDYQSGPLCIKLKISDNGMGIAPEQLQNIFDPFFTTKQAGKGTGLGLAVSYMIIDSMKGEISAESMIGKGTIFTIRLPLYFTESS